MKKILITLSAVVLSFCFCLCSSAAMLSPGISVLQANVKMEKGGVAGNKVTFSAEDFEKALGVKNAPSVKITSLPENGELMLGSARVFRGRGSTEGKTFRALLPPLCRQRRVDLWLCTRGQ